MPRAQKLTTFVDAQVAVPLSDDKVAIKAEELAKICAEIDTLKAAVATASSSARKKIRALTDEQRLLAECVRTHTEKIDPQLEFSATKKKKT